MKKEEKDKILADLRQVRRNLIKVAKRVEEIKSRK